VSLRTRSGESLGIHSRNFRLLKVLKTLLPKIGLAVAVRLWGYAFAMVRRGSESERTGESDIFARRIDAVKSLWNNLDEHFGRIDGGPVHVRIHS
jgi:hypothetical protein